MSDKANETDEAAGIAAAWGRTLERNETQEKLAGVAVNFTRSMLRVKDAAAFAREVGDPELAAKIERAVDAMLAVTSHIHARLETCARARYAHLAPRRPNGGA